MKTVMEIKMADSKKLDWILNGEKFDLIYEEYLDHLKGFALMVPSSHYVGGIKGFSKNMFRNAVYRIFNEFNEE